LARLQGGSAIMRTRSGHNSMVRGLTALLLVA
jgi:hypothetical protein